MSNNLVAFNGLVFAGNNATTYALDGGTGKIVWSTTATGSKAKIDNTYMVIGNKGVKIADGTIVWTAPAGFSFAASYFSGTGYLTDLKMFVDGNYGWNIPDPSKAPTLAWNRTSMGLNIYGDMTPMAYGNGKLFCGTYRFNVVCVDAKTGTTVWQQPTTGGAFYSASFTDGKFIWGGLDNNMRAWDANTGKLLWTYNPGTWYGMWASSVGAAYGMVYERNEDTFTYAINATTGQLVWRSKGPGVSYSNILSIADGKVYCQTGENRYRDFDTGAFADTEFDCLDAYTGNLIWSMPLDTSPPQNAQCIAFGNLYVAPANPFPATGGVWSYQQTSEGSFVGEVWCISSAAVDYPMYFADPTHSAYGAGPTDLAVKWTFKSDGAIFSSPALVNGVSYFGTLAGTIYAVNANTGTQIWTFKTEQGVKSSLAVVNGKVYTGADDGKIYCLNAATGAKLWEVNAGGIVYPPVITTGGLSFIVADTTYSSPMVLDGRVYVGSLDGNLYVLDANSGSVIWKFQAGGAIQATPTIVGNAIYIPASTQPTNGTLYKLDLSGNVIWQKQFPYQRDRNYELRNFLIASVTVAPDLGMVYLRNGIRMNYALNATTGETIWSYTGMWNPGTIYPGGVEQFMPMLYNEGLLYFNDYYGINCLNATDGSKVWYMYASREDLAQGISYSYQRIYTVTEAGSIYVLNAKTGAKESFFFNGYQWRCMPIPYNGYLYVGGCDMNMYCFGDARTLAASAPKPQAVAINEPVSSLQIEPAVPAAPSTTQTVASSSTISSPSQQQ